MGIVSHTYWPAPLGEEPMPAATVVARSARKVRPATASDGVELKLAHVRRADGRRAASGGVVPRVTMSPKTTHKSMTAHAIGTANRHHHSAEPVTMYPRITKSAMKTTIIPIAAAPSARCSGAYLARTDAAN